MSTLDPMRRSPNQAKLGRSILNRGGALIAGLLLLSPLASLAEEPAPPSPAAKSDAGGTLGIELNKLEQRESSCIVYLVFHNALDTALESLALELVLFDKAGFIQQHVTLDAAPLATDKTSVKLFDLDSVQCEQIGRILVNDVVEFADAEGTIPNAASRLELSSRLEVDLFK
jgi:hypothetical protein